MRVKEIISEANIDKDLQSQFEKDGYKLLGKGVDAHAYLAPDGTILKVIGYVKGNALPRAHQAFFDFADFCQKNSSNPFLPDFGKPEVFSFKNQTYLKVSMERLFDLKKDAKLNKVASLLHHIALYGIRDANFNFDDYIDQYMKGRYTYPKQKYDTVKDPIDSIESTDVGQLVDVLGGEEGVELFVDTIKKLKSISDAKNYRFDLHENNFMLGSDGHLVISDPFHAGEIVVFK